MKLGKIDKITLSGKLLPERVLPNHREQMEENK